MEKKHLLILEENGHIFCVLGNKVKYICNNED